MTQTAAVILGPTVVHFELPSRDEHVLPGLAWGAVEAFPTPAYWAYQVLARRVIGATIQCRLGETLAEEVCACLLGGHGIPASVGVAAFRALKGSGLFRGAASESEIFDQLSQPLSVGDRQVRYRFAKQKARYLAVALERLHSTAAPVQTGQVLRNWLMELPGIGPKTASWVARNWLAADDVAILDIHILRAGLLGGFLTPQLTVERHYLELEEEFLRFSAAIGTRPSELDAVIWFEMMSSPSTVKHLLESRHRQFENFESDSGSYERNADPVQATLLN